MSHLSKIEVEITDLVALKNACQKLQFQFKPEQKTFKWWGREDAKCDSAIYIPGARFEIGVTKVDDKFSLQTDFYDNNLKEKIGKDGGLLKQAYTIEKAKLEAIKKGYAVKEQRTKNNSIELRIQIL